MAGLDGKISDEHIVVDGEDEKENECAKKPKPTKEQYEMISQFYQAHNEESIEKSVFNQLWGNLSAQLNDIGPPAYTEAEWRRKWSVQKYNNKKRLLKMLADSEILSDEGANSSTGTPVDNEQLILRKLDDILTKQDVLLENQNILMKYLKTMQTFPKHD